MRVSLGRATGLLALLIAGCSEATGPNSAGLTPGEFSPVKTSAEATMTILQGDGQFATAGSPGAFVTIDPAIQLRDLSGNPISGETINFTASNTGARVGVGDAPGSRFFDGVTNAQGTVIVRWRLGTVGGQTLTAQAGSGGVLVTFRAIATSDGSAPVISKVQGDGLGQNSGQMRGHPARTNPVVIVEDGAGVDLPNVDVTWTADKGGSGSPPTSTTNTTGNASTVWTFGTSTGLHTIFAKLAAGPAGTPLQNVAQANFQVTPLTQGTAMNKVNGDGQTVTAGTGNKIGPKDPGVQIVTATGNVGTGVEVKFVFGTGTSDCSGNTSKFVPTNADGVALTAWCLTSGTTGTKTLNAFAGSFSSTFTATATVGAPTTLTIIQGQSCAGAVGSTCSQDPTVRLTDASGNGVDGTQITFDPSGNGVASNGSNSGNPIIVTTSGGGFAAVRWTLATTSGAQTLVATAASGHSVTFNATATAGAPTQILKINGDNQVGAPNTQTARDPTVQVLDQYGNAVNGRTIVWTAQTTGSTIQPSSLCGGTTTANSNTTGCGDGRASGIWTLGPAGTHTLRADVSGTTLTTTFTATAQ